MVAAAIALLFVGVVVWSQSSDSAQAAVKSPQAPNNLKDQKMVDEGAKLFAPSCGAAFCHGSGGVGGSAPRLRGEGLESAYLFDIISNGIPGSSMPAFKSILDEQQIWKLVAFIMSPLKGTDSSIPSGTGISRTSDSVKDSASAILTGDVRVGKVLFFDKAQTRSCHTCHTIEGAGGTIGPDLSAAAKRSPKELFTLIVLPHKTVDPRFGVIRITLKNGETLEGVKTGEDQHSIRLHQVNPTPGGARSVRKGDVDAMDSTGESPMPKDYASLYTMKQLLDLIAYIKSADGQSKSTITLNDLF
jgi:putative heme-binding domain-containing protein